MNDDIRKFGTGLDERDRAQAGVRWGIRQPEKLHSGGNSGMKARELQSPVGSWSDHVRSVSPRVTDQNLRYWMRLVMECSDEQTDELGFDEFADEWAAVVRTNAGLRVGHLGEGSVLNKAQYGDANPMHLISPQ